ncbi:MAG: sugar phosphate isomerase/epimerase family protein [Paracoccaceae bacterium]|jgi:sugar phosphate isomerase/epimerase|tara:strand:+ start:476 stop:1315 length:840 start_codon:yes stop_codon:yes gene_type:complete
MFKYSYDALVYADEPIEKSIRRVAKFGYDAIELVGEPDQHDTAEVRRLCKNNGISVSSICSIFFGPERDLVALDPEMRKKAVGYAKSVVDFAAETGAPTINLAPSPVGKLVAVGDKQQEWDLALESLGEIADYAEKAGIRTCLEPWNRYETYFINSLDQALDLAKAVGHNNLGVMGDSFHMNIEDVDIAGNYRKAGDQLFHVHFADSQRAAPGAGHIDFAPSIQALIDIDYKGYIAFELLPAAADPFATLKSGRGDEFLDHYTRMAIETIKTVEAEVRR